MIVVRVELWSAVTGKKSNLAQMTIANDGRGSQSRGNYNVEILRKGTANAQRTARVEKYPRLSYTVWELVRRALNAAYGKPGSRAEDDPDAFAAMIDVTRELFEDHERIEPHHSDLCDLCKRARAVLERVGVR